MKKLASFWWNNRIARQKEIDASIAAKAELSSTSTTSPMRTRRRFASPGRLPSRASRRTACWASMRTTSSIDPLESPTRTGDEGRLRPDDPGKPQDRRRAAGPQGGQDRVLLHSLLGPATSSAPKAVTSKATRQREREARRHLRRPGVRHRLPPRPGRRRPRSRRRRLRRY